MVTSHRTTSGRATLVSLVVLASLFLGAGSAVAGGQEQATLAVEGMVCPNCEATVESVLLGVDGVVAAEADRHDQQAIVTFDPSRASTKEMVGAINSQTYYHASVVAAGQPGHVSAGSGSDSQDAGAGGAVGAILMYTLLAAAILVLGGAIYRFTLRRRHDRAPSESQGLPSR